MSELAKSAASDAPTRGSMKRKLPKMAWLGGAVLSVGVALFSWHSQLSCRPACEMRLSQIGGRNDNVRCSQLRRLAWCMDRAVVLRRWVT